MGQLWERLDKGEGLACAVFPFIVSYLPALDAAMCEILKMCNTVLDHAFLLISSVLPPWNLTFCSLKKPGSESNREPDLFANQRSYISYNAKSQMVSLFTFGSFSQSEGFMYACLILMKLGLGWCSYFPVWNICTVACHQTGKIMQSVRFGFTSIPLRWQYWLAILCWLERVKNVNGNQGSPHLNLYVVLSLFLKDCIAKIWSFAIIFQGLTDKCSTFQKQIFPCLRKYIKVVWVQDHTLFCVTNRTYNNLLCYTALLCFIQYSAFTCGIQTN